MNRRLAAFNMYADNRRLQQAYEVAIHLRDVQGHLLVDMSLPTASHTLPRYHLMDEPSIFGPRLLSASLCGHIFSFDYLVL